MANHPRKEGGDATEKMTSYTKLCGCMRLIATNDELCDCI